MAFPWLKIIEAVIAILELIAAGMGKDNAVKEVAGITGINSRVLKEALKQFK